MPGSYPVSVSESQVTISWGNPCTRREGTAVFSNMAAHCRSFLRMPVSWLINFIDNLLQAKGARLKALVNSRRSHAILQWGNSTYQCVLVYFIFASN